MSIIIDLLLILLAIRHCSRYWNFSYHSQWRYQDYRVSKNLIAGHETKWQQNCFSRNLLLWDHLVVTFTRRRCKSGRALCFTSYIFCITVISCSLTLKERIYLGSINRGWLLEQPAMINLYNWGWGWGWLKLWELCFPVKVTWNCDKFWSVLETLDKLIRFNDCQVFVVFDEWRLWFQLPNVARVGRTVN